MGGSLEGAGGIGGLLARTSNSEFAPGDAAAHCYYHADGNGNVTALVNARQTIVALYLYDPYGNTLSLKGPLAEVNTLRFSSKEWQENSGLYYYGSRHYEPNLQRWLNRKGVGKGSVLHFSTIGLPRSALERGRPLGRCQARDTTFFIPSVPAFPTGSNVLRAANPKAPFEPGLSVYRLGPTSG